MADVVGDGDARRFLRPKEEASLSLWSSPLLRSRLDKLILRGG
jgi:hypothetical protein